jgi:hypothetical protein
MPDDDGLDRVADAAIRLHRLTTAYGTPAMQLLSRLLLMEVGTALADRRGTDAVANDNPGGGQEPDV